MNMKNSFKVAITVATFALFDYLNFIEAFRKTHSLTLQNIEALAGNESSMYSCIGKGSVDCPMSNSKVEYVFQGLYIR